MGRRKSNKTITIECIKDALSNMRDVVRHINEANVALKRLVDVVKESPANGDADTKPEQPATEEPKKRRRAVKITREEADAAKPVQEEAVASPVKHRRTPASVRLTPHEVTLNIGSQPVRDLAENDAKEFLNNPKIFWYRATQFPDPKRYRVQPRIEQVRVVQRTDPKFSRAPWTVSVTVHVDGDDKKCESWCEGVYGRNKGDQE